MTDGLKKQVCVIMPFGGDDDKKKRLAALEFKVIKYMVEKYAQEYDVAINTDIGQKFSGEINNIVLGEIAEADVVVAILEGNVNVTYELAFRHLLRGQMIVLVLDQAARPKYMDDWAYIQFSENMIEMITKQADDVVSFPGISFSKGEISQGIKEAIDNSKQTYENFAKAMRQVLEQEPTPSHFFEDLILPLQNKKIVADVSTGLDFGLGNWAPASYYPLSVVRVDWKGISDELNGKYTAEDLVQYNPEHGPIVFDANEDFLKLYTLKITPSQTLRQAVDSLNKQKPLDALNLIDHLANFADPGWDKASFLKDQGRLADNVIFIDEQAASTPFKNSDIGAADRYANIPIIIGNKHPEQEFRGKSFLPCLLARRHDGDFPRGRHSTYLLVAYIDVTDLDNIPKGLKPAPVA